MPTYLILMNWTDQGVSAEREIVHRREQADALAEKPRSMERASSKSTGRWVTMTA
jgi:uncharacterized protein with GYD domain